jgi:hypothetical protein
MKLRIACLAILCIGLVCMGNPVYAQGNKTAAPKITVLSPLGTPPAVTVKAMAEPLSTLDGKTIYLVNTGFVGTERLMEEFTKWFQANYPKANIVNKRNQGMDQPTPALWAEMKEKADGVIIALGH